MWRSDLERWNGGERNGGGSTDCREGAREPARAEWLRIVMNRAARQIIIDVRDARVCSCRGYMYFRHCVSLSPSSAAFPCRSAYGPRQFVPNSSAHRYGYCKAFRLFLSTIMSNRKCVYKYIIIIISIFCSGAVSWVVCRHECAEAAALCILNEFRQVLGLLQQYGRHRFHLRIHFVHRQLLIHTLALPPPPCLRLGSPSVFSPFWLFENTQNAFCAYEILWCRALTRISIRWQCWEMNGDNKVKCKHHSDSIRSAWIFPMRSNTC